jgi:hypothetical protein
MTSTIAASPLLFAWICPPLQANSHLPAGNATLLALLCIRQVVTRTGFAQGLVQLAGKLPGFGLTDIVQSLYVDYQHPGGAASAWKLVCTACGCRPAQAEQQIFTTAAAVNFTPDPIQNSSRQTAVSCQAVALQVAYRACL